MGADEDQCRAFGHAHPRGHPHARENESNRMTILSVYFVIVISRLVGGSLI